MSEHYYIGGFWGPRPETPASCAEQAVRFLQALTALDPLFERWAVAEKRKERLLNLPADQPLLAKLFERNRVKDSNREIMPDLGYNLTAWSQVRKGEWAHLHLHLGVTYPQLSNTCMLEPDGEPSLGRLLRIEKLAAVVGCIAQSWQIERGWANNKRIHAVAEAEPCIKEAVGWLTYRRIPPEKLPPLPAPARVIPLGPGSLIVAVEEPFLPENPAHVAALIAVYERLKEAGCLR